MNAIWTDERVETLKKLWAEGYTASSIAGCIGGVSRSAVLGKVYRLGLSGRGATGPRKEQPKHIRSRAPRIPAKPRARPAPPQIKAPTHFAAQIEDAARVDLVSLEHHHCRWPVGDPGQPGFGFCGLTTHAGPYCPAHAQRAYREFTPHPRNATAQPQRAKVNREFA